MNYFYMYRNGQGEVVKKSIEARHILEALHNARFEVMKDGGNVREMVIKNENALA